MATIHYYIRTPKKGVETSVYAQIFCSAKEKSERTLIQVNTGVKVPSSRWNKKLESVSTNMAGEEEETRLKDINDRLDGLKSHLFADIEKSDRITIDFIKNSIEEHSNNYVNKLPEAPQDIIKYMEWLMAAMRDGQRLFNGRRYIKDTVKQYGTSLGVMKRFMRHYKDNTGMGLVWNSFAKRDVADMYMKLQNESGYMDKNRNKLVSRWQTILNMAKEDGLHNHDGANLLFQVPERTKDEKVKVYLTDEEIQALYDMKLEPGSTYDKVRDIFLVGCYTGQRISDYSRISKDNFKTTKLGTTVVHLFQKKTGKEILVPILNGNLLSIMEKYDGYPPKIVDQVLNRYVKEILEILSDEVPSLQEYYPTLLTMKEKQAEKDGKTEYERDEQGNVIRPKYELVSSHTARRSCLTNLYKTHKFSDRLLMSISGHKSRETFYKYILVSGEDVAEEVAQKLEELKQERENELKSNEHLFNE